MKLVERQFKARREYVDAIEPDPGAKEQQGPFEIASGLTAAQSTWSLAYSTNFL
jgi:hypothetical protein